MQDAKSQNDSPKIEVVDISTVTPVKVKNWNPNDKSPETELYILVQSLSSRFKQIPEPIKKKSTSIESLFNYEYQSEITVTTKYLSDDERARTEITGIFNSEGDKLIVAPMGLGKSYGITKILLDNNKKAIFTVPLKVNVDQFYKDFKDDIRVKKILEPKDVNAINKDIDSTNLIFCVYDKVLAITKIIPPEQLKNWILIIDEAHNFVSLSRFRDFALRSLWHSKELFSKTIFVTGTPEVLINPLLDRQPSTPLINFTRENYLKLPQNYNIIVLKDLEIHEYLLFHLTQWAELHSDRLVIIAEENKDKLSKVKELLIASKLADEEEIIILSMDHKDSDDYQRTVHTSRIPSGKKYLLCTSVISDGFNITETNAIAFYSINWRDVTKLRQVQSRLRDAPIDLTFYDLIEDRGTNYYRINENLYDINHLFISNNFSLANLAKIYSIIINPELVNKDFDSFYLDKTVYKLGAKFLVDNFALYQNLCEDFLYNHLIAKPLIRKDFISRYFSFENDRITLDTIYQTDKEFKSEYDKVTLSILRKRFDDLIKILIYDYATKEKARKLLNQFKKYEKNEKVFELLNDKLLQLVTNRYADLLEIGFTNEGCRDILTIERNRFISCYNNDELFSNKSLTYNVIDVPILSLQLVNMKLFYDVLSNRRLPKPLKGKILIAQAILKNLNQHPNYLVLNEIKETLPEVSPKDISTFYNSIFKLKRNGKDNKLKKIDTLKVQDLFNKNNFHLTEAQINKFKEYGFPT